MEEGWHEAAWENRLEMARLLVAYGANANSGDADGQTPLHVAALNGYRQLFDLLVARGADPHAKNQQGLTPFDYTRAPAAPQVVRVRVDGKNPYSIIITSQNEARHFLRSLLIPFERVWIPNKCDIEALDLKAAIEQGFRSGSRVSPHIDYLLDHLPEYNQEYAGFIREDRKYVFCNMDWGEPERDFNDPRFSWVSQWRVVIDLAGGTAVQISP